MLRTALAVDDQTSKRVVTIPNVITFVRLLCIPVFLWLLFGRENRAAAGWLLGVLGMTDWVDGFLARCTTPFEVRMIPLDAWFSLLEGAPPGFAYVDSRGSLSRLSSLPVEILSPTPSPGGR